jgi:hypothetical protein
MKKFAVMLNNNRVQNKALHDDGAITDTALLYNDNVFELPLAKQTKRKILISNSFLKSSIGIYYAKNLFVKETV